MIPSENCLTFPASIAQQSLYLAEQLLPPHQSGFALSWTLKLYGKLDVPRLLQSLQKAVDYQSIFRTCFHHDGTSLIQVVSPHATAACHIVDFSQFPEDEHIARSQDFLAKNTQPLSLNQLPLIRFIIVKVKEDVHHIITYSHHIITDGMSRSIWADQLLAFYHGQTLPALAMSYGEYAAWQKKMLESHTWVEHAEYWQNQLQEAKPISHLPVDYARPKVASVKGTILFHEFPLSLAAQVRSMKEKHDISLFRAMYAAFAMFLSRLTGEDDLVLGTTFAARVLPEFANIIGPINNIAALRLHIPPDITYAQLLEQVKQKFKEGLKHQIYPYQKVLEQLNPLRAPRQEVINSIHFSQIPAVRKFTSHEFVVEDSRVFTAVLPLDWLVYCQEHDQTIRLISISSNDLFSKTTIARLLQQFEYVLQQLMENQNKKIDDYSLVLPEQRKILPDPQQNLFYQASKNIPECFQEQVQKFPTKIAVRDTCESWSYQDLEQYSNQLSHWLLEKGIQANDFVAILAERNVWLPWAILGIWKIGAGVILLDSNYPGSRLIRCWELTRPKAWIALPEATMNEELRRYLMKQNDITAYYELDSDYSKVKKIFANYSPSYPSIKLANIIQSGTLQSGISSIEPLSAQSGTSCQALSEIPAYILFTSGTTGIPKAIWGKQTPIVHFLDWQRRKFAFTSQERFSMLSGLAHDPIFRDIFAPLCMGATLLIPSSRIIHSGALSSWIKQNGITVTHLTPGIAQLMTLEIVSQDTKAYNPQQAWKGVSLLSSLRYAFLGGDVFTRQIAQKFQAIAPHCQLVNFYGTTETPQGIAYFVLTQEDIHSDSSTISEASHQTRKEVIPIGQGIDDVQVLVLNPGLHITAVGELGEIYVRTPYLSLGYYHDADATQQKFLHNPYSQNNPRDRMYKTGDIGRYDIHGDVEFLGRRDQQIKIRGFRIEPQEIEGILVEHPSIQSAIIRIRQDQQSQPVLVAYIIPKNLPTQEQELRDFLLQKIPFYMVPTRFIFLDRFPLTGNGKVAENDLAIIENKTCTTTSSPLVSRIPSNSEEEILFLLWKSILGVVEVNPQDNFFDLGGHSLLLPALAMQIQERLGISISTIDILQHPIFSSLYRLIKQKMLVWHDEKYQETQEYKKQSKYPVYYLIPSLAEYTNMPPLFCFAGLPDFGIYFHHLAKMLGYNRPIYIFPGPYIRFPNTVEQPLIDIYTHCIKKIYPAGQCAFLGYCFSGYLAYAVAQKLMQDGYSISFLGLIRTRRYRTQKVVQEAIRPLLWIWRHTKFVPAWIRHFGYKVLASVASKILRQEFPHNFRLLQDELGYSWDRKTWNGNLYLFSEPLLLQQDLVEWKKLVHGQVFAEEIAGMHWDVVADMDNLKLLSQKIRKYL